MKATKTPIKLGLILLALSSLFLTNCKKDPKICTSYTHLPSQLNIVDLNLLKGGGQKILDTLAKYPQLQAYSLFIDHNIIVLQCDFFYKGLLIFTEQYSLTEIISDSNVQISDTLPDSINIPLTPTITYDKAIAIARQNENFNQTCISYRLGIYDINAGQGLKTKNYKLTWLVLGSDTGYPIVYLDANTGQIYYKFDGIIQ